MDSEKHYRKDCSDYEIEKWQSKYENNTSLIKARNDIFSVRKGDLVITRYDGNAYIGRVNEEAFVQRDLIKDLGNEAPLSWMCSVEEWIRINKLPAALSGRLSQKRQSTIKSIKDGDQKLLMIYVYEQESGEKILGVPKVKLTVDNFANALDYKDLEDLVCAYIYDRHNDYMILPSSCKVSRPKYEFDFVSINKKPVTCQVKNQNAEKIKVSDYEVDKDLYEKIYLFSGNGNYNGTSIDNIEIISDKELYKSLINSKDNRMGFIRSKIKNYYDLTNESISDNVERIIKVLESKDWKETNGRLGKKKYKIWSGKTGISVLGGYYSGIYDCFISWDNGKFKCLTDDVDVEFI